MIGNDVIDIRQSRVESNWQRKGLREKLFTLDEQQLIATSTNSEITLWLLWSMKEAAYKIYHRQTNIRQFMPIKLVCSLNSQNREMVSGTVYCEGDVYYTQTLLCDEYIHSVAVTSLHDFNRVSEIENQGILKDKYGIPYRIMPNQIDRQAVSISHHGRYEKVVSLRPEYTISI